MLLPSLSVVDTKLITEEEREVLGMLTQVERLQAAREIQGRNDLGTQRENRLKEESLGKDVERKDPPRQKARGRKPPGRGSRPAPSSGRRDPAAAPASSSDLVATMDRMLPSFEPTKQQLDLLGKPEGRGKFVGLVKRKPVKHSNGVTVTPTVKCRAALCDPKAHLVEYEAKYPGSAVAVVVKHDGSALAKWPGDQLAVCVDGNVLDSAGKKRYSLFASYRSTRVAAVSFDMQVSKEEMKGRPPEILFSFSLSSPSKIEWLTSHTHTHTHTHTLSLSLFVLKGNGFVNWPNGQALLSYSADTDKGVQYDHKGKIVRTWNVKGSASVADSVEVLLDQNLAFRHKMPEGVAEVWLACNTVRHALVAGYNAPKKVWGEPGDQGAPGFLAELNERNPTADTIAQRAAASPSKRRGKAKAEETDVAAGPGVSLSSLSDLTASLQKLNTDLLNGSILKATT